MASRNASAERGDKKGKPKGKPAGGDTKAKKHTAGNSAVEAEEKIVRKVRAKPRGSSTSTTSKYFPSPPESETRGDGRDGGDEDLCVVTTATPVLPTVVTGPSPPKTEDSEEEDESDEDDWEEVEELAGPLGPEPPAEPSLPPQPVEIEIETPDLIHRRQKKEKRKAEFELYLKRMVNTANGMFRNRLCSEPDLLAVTLSLLPTHFTAVATDRIDHNYLSGLLKWFGATFTLNPSLPHEDLPDPRALLERRLASLSARDHREMTHLFLLVLRSLHLCCRLVLSLQPIPLKPPRKGKGSDSSGKTPKETSLDPVSPGTKRPAPASSAGRGGKRAKQREEVKEEDEEREEGKGEEKSGRKGGGQRPKNAKRRSVASKVSYKEESGSEEEEHSDEEEEEEEFQVTAEEENSDDEEEEEEGGGAKRGKGSGRGKRKHGSGDSVKKRNSSGGKRREKINNNDEEEEEEEGTRSKRRSGGGGGGGGRKRRREGGAGAAAGAADEWLEVFVQKASAWVCVDVAHGVDRPQRCWRSATPPLTYVVAVDGAGRLRDLGRKYDPAWMTLSRRRRVDEEWWGATLAPFLGFEEERDDKEEKELQAKLLDRPLPTSIAELKNHPLYALPRHLLKYEALYPPTAAVLGYCRGEPLYSRDCVHQLHSRDTWLKEARTVRLGEEPYKMVKGFSNRSRKARMLVEQKEEKDLALFGEWQTEEYQPPVAVEGKVPRNEYGNVYLFRPSMLPLGCVHLRLPSLSRVARRLELDAAPAVTGFDFHGGYSHAVTDGYVVCEEHEEILRAAWQEDQALQKQKEREKREKRAVSHWKLLVKGLLIKERLQRRYGRRSLGGAGGAGLEERGGRGLGGAGGAGLEERGGRGLGGEAADGLSSDGEEEEEGGVPAEDPGAKTAAETLAMSWPQNRQEEEEEQQSGPKRKITKREQKRQQETMFPFEKV